MSVLNLAAFDRAPLKREPFDFPVVKDAIESDTVEVLNRDYPQIDKPTSYDPGDLDDEVICMLRVSFQLACFPRLVGGVIVQIERTVPKSSALLLACCLPGRKAILCLVF